MKGVSPGRGNAYLVPPLGDLGDAIDAGRYIISLVRQKFAHLETAAQAST